MSDLIVKDGTGTGNRAKVDIDNNLHVYAITGRDIAIGALTGKAFSIQAQELPLLSDAVETALLWFKITDPTRYFRIDSIVVGWDGGSTNHNNIVYGRIYTGSTDPSANYVVTGAGNLNFQSRTAALIDVSQWDGVGDGMTIASLGFKIFSTMFSIGTTYVPIDGVMILGYGDVLCFTGQPGEAGIVSLSVTGWFEAIEE